MVLSVDDVVAKFPIKTVPMIDGKPDYTTINTMVQLLYGNAASLPTTLGGGQHGHIGLIMTAQLYTTLSATPYDSPPDPGITPTHAIGASAETRQTNFLVHKEERRIFNNHQTMEDALKALIIDSVDDVYIGELRNKYTGYLGITARDLFDYLLDRYGKSTPADIEECKNQIQESIDSTQPIDLYFRCINDNVQYAANGNIAFTTGQILQTTYHAVSSTGFYNEACKEWRRKPEADKTWVQFKQFFAAEYHDRKEQDKVNKSQNNFHSANAAVDLTQALDNLAMAAITDRDIVAQLTAINQQLTTTSTHLSAQLQTALATNATLVAQLKGTANTTIVPATTITLTTNPTPTATNNSNKRPPFDMAAWTASLDPTGYCWSHGYGVVSGHNSENCKGKLMGHVDAATRTNNLGGSTRGKPN